MAEKFDIPKDDPKSADATNLADLADFADFTDFEDDDKKSTDAKNAANTTDATDATDNADTADTADDDKKSVSSLDLADIDALLSGTFSENLAVSTSAPEGTKNDEVDAITPPSALDKTSDPDKKPKEHPDLPTEESLASVFQDDLAAQLIVKKESTPSPETPITPALPVEENNRQPLDDKQRALETLLSLPVDVSVILGSNNNNLSISDLLLMGQGSVIELDRLLGDDLDVFVNNRPIAKGEIVVSNDSFGCKISHILNPFERLRKLVLNK
ncbi:MAG: FliM/FliN family flagellar motor switch protein [SAR324 cluster bacterium]|nr:FliM/FliN family flagellar motor switch protein [SAR324 cluster bacterium]